MIRNLIVTAAVVLTIPLSGTALPALPAQKEDMPVTGPEVEIHISGIGLSVPVQVRTDDYTIGLQKEIAAIRSETGSAIFGFRIHFQTQEETGKGGVMAGFKSILFGPRVGIETNENQPVSFIEKANAFVPIAPFQAYSENGIKGFLASAFIGPRVGMQIDERKIRFKEWLGLIPAAGVAYHLSTSNPTTTIVIIEAAGAAILSRLWSALDAFRGKTMSDIEIDEDLRK